MEKYLEMIGTCSDYDPLLTDLEVEFISSLEDQIIDNDTITENQKEALERIYQRIISCSSII